MKKIISNLSLSFLAGFLIGLGGFVNLYCTLKFNNPIAGACFFATGLIFVCFLGCNLFTGKVGYIFENKLSYSLDVLIMIVGNMIGAMVIGLIFAYTNNIDSEVLTNFIKNKIASLDTGYSEGVLFLKAILAGICVFFAVEAFKKFTSPVAKIVGIILSIGTMVLIGGEHSVANCFYFFASIKNIPLNLGLNVFTSLILSIIGNIFGSLFIWALFYLGNKLVKKE